MLYAGGVSIYNGPLVATPGYLLVLIAAALALLTWPSAPEVSAPDDSPEDALATPPPAEPAEAAEPWADPGTG